MVKPFAWFHHAKTLAGEDNSKSQQKRNITYSRSISSQDVGRYKNQANNNTYNIEMNTKYL